MTAQPHFFLHIDLDGLWTLPACYGYAEGRDFKDDPVFEIAIDRLLELLASLNLRATWFIVGRDLESKTKSKKFYSIAAAGHAFAIHSFSHNLALERHSPQTIQQEIEATRVLIARHTNYEAIGFRAPGYGAGPKILEACARAGLKYDGSLFPSRLGPILRTGMRSLRRRVQHNLKTSDTFQPAKPPALKNTYGGAERDPQKRSLKPHSIKTPAGELLRLPVAVTPHLRLPLQASLSIHMGANRVTRACESIARANDSFTWLLHGLDLLGPEDLANRLPPALANSRTFNLPLEKKLTFIRSVLTKLSTIAQPTLTEDWLKSLKSRK